MKIQSKIKRFQEGGAAPAPEAATAQPAAQQGAEQGGGKDPLAQLAQMAQQALQSKDANTAFAVCEGLLQLISQMMQSQGGGAPQVGGEPVYAKKGAKLKKVKVIKKEGMKKC